MERLTYYAEAYGCGFIWRLKMPYSLQDALDRLAAYEDAMPLDRAQELARAEKDGRLVVLPCKVGDDVWVNDDCVRDWSVEPLPYKCRVFGIEITGKEKRFHVECYKTGRIFPFDFDQVGKAVFLTCEEAEAALKKREGTK